MRDVKNLITLFAILSLVVFAWFSSSTNVSFTLEPLPPRIDDMTDAATGAPSVSIKSEIVDPQKTTETMPTTETQTSVSSQIFSNSELFSLADDKYADGNVPLGDYKYTTTGPKKGYVYLCAEHKDNPGSMVDGPWMHGQMWNYLDKVFVNGEVSWPNAAFSDNISGTSRVFKGNGLPISHTTGVFPVRSSDDAYQYDKNPNTISVQKFSKSLPVHPTFSDTPNCVGGEVGIMLTGVPLFNAFDAGLRDAPAHELQDSCDGHPQGSGEYHYHSLSACFKDIYVSTVLGFALDGFPITGPKVAEGRYLTTEDLDVCHGLRSEIMLDGKRVVTYHYVMTRDFPYSVSCFRGKPASLFVIQGTGPRQGSNEQQSATLQIQMPPQVQPSQADAPGSRPTPPPEAVSACTDMAHGDQCQFSTPDGIEISGHCDTPPGQSSLACIPH